MSSPLLTSISASLGWLTYIIIVVSEVGQGVIRRFWELLHWHAKVCLMQVMVKVAGYLQRVKK